jgi:hypothetical protein
MLNEESDCREQSLLFLHHSWRRRRGVQEKVQDLLARDDRDRPKSVLEVCVRGVAREADVGSMVFEVENALCDIMRISGRGRDGHDEGDRTKDETTDRQKDHYFSHRKPPTRSEFFSKTWLPPVERSRQNLADSGEVTRVPTSTAIRSSRTIDRYQQSVLPGTRCGDDLPADEFLKK